MEVSVLLDTNVMCPGEPVRGSVSLASVMSKADLTSLERYFLFNGKDCDHAETHFLPHLLFSVNVSGRAHVVSKIVDPDDPLQQEDISLLESPLINAQIERSTTRFFFNFEFILPNAPLPPSCPRGAALRCVYFVQLQMRLPGSSKPLRTFRAPIALRCSHVEIGHPKTHQCKDAKLLGVQYGHNCIQNQGKSIWKDPTTQDDCRERCSSSASLKQIQPDDMMEESLLQMEAELRSHFDAYGLEQPERDWSWNHRVDAFDDLDQADESVDPFFTALSVWYRIVYQGQVITRLELNRNQYCLGSVIRGRYSFDSCRCIHVSCHLITEEDVTDNEAAKANTRLVWGSNSQDTRHTSSTQFSLPLPQERSAPPNYSTDRVSVSWVLEFKFLLQSEEEVAKLRVDQCAELSEEHKQMFSKKRECMEWRLPLDVAPCHPSAPRPMNVVSTFFVPERELR